MTVAVPMGEFVLTSYSWIQRTQQLLESCERRIGQPLIVRSQPEIAALTVANATFVAVAHGDEADLLLNYANWAALSLWQRSLSEFLGTSSWVKAKSMHRDEYVELLQVTPEAGFSSDCFERPKVLDS